MRKQLARVDLENGNRICNTCKTEKALEDFPKDKKCKLGRARTCKDCTYKLRRNRKDKVKENQRDWYQKNRDRILEQRKKYYEKNKEHLQAYGRQHAKENPEIYKAARHRRRAAIMNNGNNDLTANQIVYLFDLQDFCTYCNSKDDLTIDHIIPISRGGQNTLSNITVACGSCNNDKRAKLSDEL